MERDRVLCEFRRGGDLQMHEVDVQFIAGHAGDFHGLYVQLRGRPGQRDANRKHHVEYTKLRTSRSLGSHGNTMYGTLEYYIIDKRVFYNTCSVRL